MKRTAGLSVMFLMLMAPVVSGQITGAVITPAGFNVGTVLRAGHTGTPASGDFVDYEWFYSPSGTSIGTDSTYTISASDQGKSIYAAAIEKSGTDSSVVLTVNSPSSTVNSFPVASYIGISGTPRSGMTLNGTYVYSDVDNDPESGSTYQWYRGTSPGGAGSTAIGLAVSNSYKLTNSDINYYIGFSVMPASSTGSSPGSSVTTSVWIGPVLANSAPVASSVNITGIYQKNNTLFGSYSYSDVEGDAEGTSTYQWYTATTSGGSGQAAISGATQLSYKLTNSETGKYIAFSVTPVAVTGTTPGTTVFSSWGGPVSNAVPVASSVVIIGNLHTNSTLFGNYSYYDASGDQEGTSIYQWYTATSAGGAGQAAISGANQVSYTLTGNETGKYIAFSVTPVSSAGMTGTAVLSSWTGPVINNAPVASSLYITGTLNVNDVLTGHYTYSDTEGDLESGSSYQWSRCATSGGTYANITGETSISHRIAMSEQGMFFRFSVTPKAATGTSPGTTVTTATYAGPANSAPYADNVAISGTASVGDILTGTYNYHDADTDAEGSSQYQWYRGSTAISGATSLTYSLTSNDVDNYITFKVTPVSATGYPNTGNTYSSASVGPVNDPSSGLPVASNLCISGIRQTGQQLTGNYQYSNKYHESGTKYLWYSGGTLVQSGTDNSDLDYTLVSGDINKDIVFEVIPSNSRGQTGDTASSSSLAMFDLSRDVFSVADTGQLLVAEPAGGVFSGPAVTNGYFYPAVAGTAGSPYTVQYLLTVGTSTTCVQKAFASLTVNPVVVYFDGIKNVFCDNNGVDTVHVRNVPVASSLKLFSITDPNSNLIQISDTCAVFNPDLMKNGDKQDTIYFSYYDGATLIQVKNALEINHVGTISILNLNPGTNICSNTTPFELYASLAGGVFTGPVSSDILDPSLVSHMGDTTVTYTYTSSHGCVQKAVVPITVNKAPVVGFAPADSCIRSSSDSTRFLNLTVSPDSVATWGWQFSESGSTITSSEKSPSYLYKAGGYHLVTLTATTVNNCSSSKNITINLGSKPVAGFTWRNECFHPGDSISFFDNTVSPTTITSRSWNFFDGDSLHTVMNPVYPKKSVGYLKIKYIVRTAFSGCYDTLVRQIYIRPSFAPGKDTAYFENFEKGDGGWVRDYRTVNTWTFGTPDRPVIDYAASGDSAWFTNYNILNQDTASYSVISPCFDFTALDRPMIKMMLWKRFDRNRDGAALQYRITDSGTWTYVGTLGDGINWYNSALINGRPGGDLLGWTTIGTPETGWSEARHKLDDLCGKKDVEFRMAYGSDGTSQDNDGIAFDDVWIGERTRSVLLEHFENTSSAASSAATAMVDTIVAHNTKDVINIQYHTNFPGADPYYNDNPGDVSARVLYYGLTRAPYSFVDGGFDKSVYATLYDYSLSDIDSLDITCRSLTTPVFDIGLNSNISGGVLTVSGQLTALQTVDVENMTLYYAVTEKENTDHTGADGESVFMNVFRKLIPDAGGLNLKKSWTAGDVVTIPDQSWVIANIKNSSDIEVTAFLQNNITKEVYQAASQIKSDIVTGIENIYSNGGNGFSVYPNPAIRKLKIEFTEPPAEGPDIRIYDLQGILVRTYRAAQGISEFTIDNLGLKPGMYFIKISSGSSEIGFRKLIVAGN
ncbi:MAG: T9SS type A sorting domain-containing protein [Bacteroidales bacterium]|jgi:hypothetical protein